MLTAAAGVQAAAGEAADIVTKLAPAVVAGVEAAVALKNKLSNTPTVLGSTHVRAVCLHPPGSASQLCMSLTMGHALQAAAAGSGRRLMMRETGLLLQH